MSYVVSAPTNAHAKEIIGFPNGLLTRALTLEFPPNLNISPILTLQSVCLSLYVRLSVRSVQVKL